MVPEGNSLPIPSVDPEYDEDDGAALAAELGAELGAELATEPGTLHLACRGCMRGVAEFWAVLGYPRAG